MQSGDCPGLQNRRVAGFPVTGGFDSHSLPPIFNGLGSAPAVSPAVECQMSLSFHSQTAISSVTTSP